MAVGNLEFIKSATGTSVSSLSVTDCFSDNYDVYKIVTRNFTSTVDASEGYRLLDSGGTVISASEYEYAYLQLNAYGAFGEFRSTSNTFIRDTGYSDASGTQGTGSTLYIYNPFDSSSYTFFQSQASTFNTGSGGIGRKGIGVHKSAESCTGLNILANSGSLSIEVSVDGVK